MWYLIAGGVLILAYILVIYAMKYMKRVKLCNTIFALSVFGLYITHLIIVFRSVGWSDWNFQNTLPVANVSPFMFAMMPIVLIMPQPIKKYLQNLVCLLMVGMFLSTIFNCIYNASINYKFHFHFMLDYIAHFILSLWGIYLIRSGQVRVEIRKSIKSGCIILGVALLMLVLNVVFDKAFFGLSLNGKHNIYNNVLTDSSVLSALIYFFGLTAVLVMGYYASNLVGKKLEKVIIK